MGKFFWGGLGLGGETSDRTAPVGENVQEVDIHLGSDGTGGAGFLTMEEYIRRSHNTVAQYIAT